MSEVQAIKFPNAQGFALFGTLHTPTHRNRQLPAVVLLSPGVKMRVGPGRLYVPLTEQMVAMGYTVLRFDFFGLGDSEGELLDEMLADLYNNIEVGRYVDDTLCALKWLRHTHGFRRFVLGGLCGGAITALLAAERDHSVEALLSLGMTVTLASNAANPSKYLTGAQLDWRRKRYLRKLLQPKAWLRFLSFRSEYGVIWRSMKRAFVKATPPPAPPTPATASPEQRGNANPLFPRAYFSFLKRGGRALMVFSERDRLQSEYDEKFRQPYAAQLRSFSSQIEQHVIANANHVLTFREWQEQMLAFSRAWLTRLHASA